MNEDFLARPKLEKNEEWHKWYKEMPELKLKEGWKIKVTPPFAGAIVRFNIIKGEASVSVYLDCYDKLGCFGEPYWEIYPYDEDVYRVVMADTDELIKRIDESLENQINYRTASSS